jgi:glucose-1-phosphate thymidylyltransferase
MKGVVLAGGSGSRLDPLTRVTNKHLLPVYDRPMIYFAVEALVRSGIDRVLVVTGGPHAGEFEPLLGDGSSVGACIEYVRQERPAGIADALGLARSFAGGESVCLYLGDNVFERSLRASAERFRAQGIGARVLLAEVDRPEAYGVATVRDGRIVRIDEKPAKPEGRLAVTGCYFYDGGVFDLIPTLKPSGRGELEISDINSAYLERGQLQYEVVGGYWVDCGESFNAYLHSQNLVAKHGANR